MVTRRKREELRLRKASLTDDLTRLYNRRGFLTLAEQQLRVARRQGKDAVVMYADMDGFKQLNDTFGHAVGDRALQAVSRLLQSTVRDCDVVGFAWRANDPELGEGRVAVRRAVPAAEGAATTGCAAP